MDAVGATHHQGPGVLAGTGHDGLDDGVQAGQDEVRGGPALQRQRRVHDVAAGQAEVQEAAFLADALGDLCHEGHDVVVGGALQLGDAVDVDTGAGGDAATASDGTSPRSASTRRTASSTRSMCSKRLRSDHSSAMAGSV